MGRRKSGSVSSDLRIADLIARGSPPPSKLMNIKIPQTVAERVARIVRETGATKTDVIIALLNEGLDVAAADPDLRDRLPKSRREADIRSTGGEGGEQLL